MIKGSLYICFESNGKFDTKDYLHINNTSRGHCSILKLDDIIDDSLLRGSVIYPLPFFICFW